MADKIRNLKILQWNCRSISRNLPYLIDYLSKGSYAILCLQSLNCHYSKLPKLDGFYYPPVRGETLDKTRVGTAIYIKIGLAFQHVPSPVRDLPGTAISCAIKLQLVNREINICNIYHPIPDRQGSWTDRFPNPGWLVVGDFNIHSQVWDKNPVTREDITAREAILNSELVIMNDGSATRLPDNPNQLPTAIDLSLASPDIACDVEWLVGDEPLSSDHLPITINLHLGAVINPPIHTQHYKYDKADWHSFRQHLELRPLTGIKDLTIEDLNSTIINNILAAANKSIPVTKPGGTRTRNNPWWTPECDAAVREKHRACRRYMKHRCT